MKYLLKKWGSINQDKREIYLKNQIISKYRNKDLITFFEELMLKSKTVNQKLYYLKFSKKIVLQNERLPPKEHLEAFKDEYHAFFKSIEREQKNNEPLQWLNAEIEFIETSIISKQIEEPLEPTKDDQDKKDWITFNEMLLRFETSKMALRRRMAEGLPFIKFGNQLRFNPNEVDKWLASQK